MRLAVKYRPGNQMHIADTLSRAYVSNGTEIEESDLYLVFGVMTYYPASNSRIDSYKHATLQDETSQIVKRYIQKGWPARRGLPLGLLQYYDKRSDIYVEDDLLFFGKKLIVPKQERPFALQRLHMGHQGIEKTKALARGIVYWPGISDDIENTVKMCNVCQKYRRCNTREPIKQHEVPDYPWLKLGADLFHFGNKDYLLVVDYYSKFPEVSCLNTKSAQSVILALKPILARNGIPEVLVADNMPFASVEFRTFAKQWNFHVVTSSLHYPKSKWRGREICWNCQNDIAKVL